MAAVRRRALSHLHNFRDLGGYETKDQAMIIWGKLFRSDCPDALEDAEWDTFRALNIRNIMDLRSTYEAKENPVQAPENITYHHCPFLKEDASIEDPEEAARKFLDSLSLDYAVMLQNSLDEMAAILLRLTDLLEEGGVDFFCTAGKDRTGILAAAVLYLCGVADEEIIADYSVTEIYNAKVIQARIDSLPESMKAEIPPEKMSLATASKAETMEALLDWMHTNHFSHIMKERGFGEEQADRLRASLLRR